MKAPSIIMVVASPGMPSVSSGIMAPPVEAQLATSEAMMPLGLPVPKVSGSLEAALAWE